jgi:hypothetical protein
MHDALTGFRRTVRIVLIAACVCGAGCHDPNSFEPAKYVGRASPLRKMTPAQIESHILSRTAYHEVEEGMLVLAYMMERAPEARARAAVDAFMRVYWKLRGGWDGDLLPTFLLPSSTGIHPVYISDGEPSFRIRSLSVLASTLYGAAHKRPDRTFIRDAAGQIPPMTDEERELDARGSPAERYLPPE